jgi:hypothetical protein
MNDDDNDNNKSFCSDRYAYRNIEDCPKVILLDLKLPLMDRP